MNNVFQIALINPINSLRDDKKKISRRLSKLKSVSIINRLGMKVYNWCTYGLGSLMQFLAVHSERPKIAYLFSVDFA